MDITLQRILSLLPHTSEGKIVHGAKKEFADSLGLSHNLVTMWEKGQSKSYSGYLYQIASVYGVSVEWLKGESDEKKEAAATESDSLIKEYNIQTGEVRTDVQISLLRALYKMPTRVMASAIRVSEERAEKLILCLEKASDTELEAASEFFDLDINRLRNGWVPLSTSERVRSKSSMLQELVFPSEKTQD